MISIIILLYVRITIIAIPFDNIWKYKTDAKRKAVSEHPATELHVPEQLRCRHHKQGWLCSKWSQFRVLASLIKFRWIYLPKNIFSLFSIYVFKHEILFIIIGENHFKTMSLENSQPEASYWRPDNAEGSLRSNERCVNCVDFSREYSEHILGTSATSHAIDVHKLFFRLSCLTIFS